MKLLNLFIFVGCLFCPVLWAAEKPPLPNPLPQAPSMLSLGQGERGSIRGDGALSIYNYHENEYAEVKFREGSKYLPEEVAKIEKLLRSHGDGTLHKIDIRLIDALDNIEDHFGAETIEMISGYRSPSYNKSLKDDGRHVASESLHMQGQAIDLHIDEIKDAELFDYIRSLKLGGVGIYPKNAFVHFDVGPIKTWDGGGSGIRKLIGTENNPNSAWSAVTDKNIYSKEDSVSVKIANNDYNKQKLIKNIWLEKFSKGTWQKGVPINKNAGSEIVSKGQSLEYVWDIPKDQPFGKYRLAIFANKDFEVPPVLSNEFYIKK